MPDLYEAIPDSVKREAQYNFLSKVVKPDKKEVSDTMKDKVMWAALGAMGALATNSIIPRLLKKPLSATQVLATTAAGGTAGYLAPKFHNIVLREQQGKLPAGSGKRQMKENDEKIKEVKEKIVARFGTKKEAAFLGTVARTATQAISKGVSGGAKAIGSGLLPTKKTYRGGGVWKKPLGARIWGYTVKGGLGLGALVGSKSLYDRTRIRSGANYATLLRNNLLAGNIKPEELSQSDLAAVSKIGMQ